MYRRMLSVLGIIDNATRPHVISGRIRSVTDLRTGETLMVSYQQTMRDARGRIRTTRKLEAR